jgi:hypothetical protein
MSSNKTYNVELTQEELIELKEILDNRIERAYDDPEYEKLLNGILIEVEFTLSMIKL